MNTFHSNNGWLLSKVYSQIPCNYCEENLWLNVRVTIPTLFWINRWSQNHNPERVINKVLRGKSKLLMHNNSASDYCMHNSLNIDCIHHSGGARGGSNKPFCFAAALHILRTRAVYPKHWSAFAHNNIVKFDDPETIITSFLINILM